jgi:hypothetical protein
MESSGSENDTAPDRKAGGGLRFATAYSAVYSVRARSTLEALTPDQ